MKTNNYTLNFSNSALLQLFAKRYAYINFFCTETTEQVNILDKSIHVKFMFIYKMVTKVSIALKYKKTMPISQCYSLHKTHTLVNYTYKSQK